MTPASASDLRISPLPTDKTRLADELVRGLDATALNWLSGYMAGAAARLDGVADTAAAVPSGQADARLTVFYGSQTGNARRAAERLARRGEESGLTVQLVRADAYHTHQLKSERLLYVVISTHSEGDTVEPPDDARGFIEFLESRRAPRLPALHYAVLALGDTSYPDFCGIGRQVDERLEALGAQRLQSRGEADVDIDSVAAPWTREALENAARHLSPVDAAAPRAASTGVVTALRPTTQAWTRHIFVNVVDDAVRSRFHVPARLQRGPLTVAVSSGGRAPALARHVRVQLEARLDPTLGTLAEFTAQYRERIRRAFPDVHARRRFYDALPEGPVADALRRARPDVAERELLSQLDGAGVAARGHVSLVGAGPGDPGLLTLKALRAIEHADVIVHDRLVDAAIMELARRDALTVDVGKRIGGDHEATQARIHRLLLEHVQAGRHVVRLKGGDPLVFGRGGEELEFLHAHGIAYDMVPGITAAIACAAHAGVPLTHRGHASSLHITTAHRTRTLDARDWRTLASPHQTLAIYMAVSQLDDLPRHLLAHGRAPETPFVLVENGSRASQRLVTGRLDQLTTLARQYQVRAPSLLIVGEVAALAPRLAWFGRCIDGGEALAPTA